MSKKKARKKQQNQKMNKKQLATTMLAMVMVAVVAVVGTLAYLSRKTEEKTNTFTGSPGIDVELTEPSWEPTKAGDYTPDKEIGKDPKLTNTSKISGTSATADELDKVAEWVAIKITFQARSITEADTENNIEEEKSKFKLTNAGEKNTTGIEKSTGDEISYAQLKTIIKDISFNSTDDFKFSSQDADANKWVLIQGKTTSEGKIDGQAISLIFMYNTTLERTAVVAGGKETATLFDKIKILPQSTLSGNGYTLDAKQSAQDKLPGFDIVVQGAAIKNESKADKKYMDGDTAKLITKFTMVKDKYGDEEQTNIKKELVKLLGGVKYYDTSGNLVTETEYQTALDPNYEEPNP